MKIQNVTPSFTGNPIRIARNMTGNDLTSRPYLYNEVMEIVKENKIPATISSKGIDLPDAGKKVKEQLKELGIKFQVVI